MIDAAPCNVHAGCVRLGRAGAAFGAPDDTGILILGESGSGKSDLMLRLIADGATLVADDRADLAVTAGALIASPPPALAGLIEVRGLGIIALPYCADARIGLAVELTSGEPPARMPHRARWRPPAALALPQSAWPALIRLNPFEISAAARIAAAAAAFAHALFREEIKPN